MKIRVSIQVYPCRSDQAGHIQNILEWFGVSDITSNTNSLRFSWASEDNVSTFEGSIDMEPGIESEVTVRALRKKMAVMFPILETTVYQSYEDKSLT